VIPCLFTADLHGSAHRAETLLAAVRRERPRAVFLGGDLLAHRADGGYLESLLIPGFAEARRALAPAAPEVFVILGNDDPRAHEPVVADAAARGIWRYLHDASAELDGFLILGYNCVPPTPFRLKDWERYDVSRYVDPGCVSPEEGAHSVPVPPRDVRYGTIASDLERLAGGRDLAHAVCLFHCPPYRTALDRAALDDRRVEHAPADVHVGSIAIRSFFEARGPWLGLHGHVHESARLTGAWHDRVGRTVVLSGAHDGPELALVRFDLEHPDEATRELI
jgi:Icc-related predicted phosphoesterase